MCVYMWSRYVHIVNYRGIIYIYIHTYIHTYTLWIESMWEYQEGWSLLRHPMERDRIVGFWQSLNMQRKLNEVPPERNPSKCLCLSWEMWHWFCLKPAMKFHMQTAAVVIALLLDHHRTTTTRSFWTQRHERTWRWIAMRRLPSLALAVASIEPLDPPVEFVAPKLNIGWIQKLNKMIQPTCAFSICIVGLHALAFPHIRLHAALSSSIVQFFLNDATL